MRTRRRRLRGASIGALLALALAGCSAPSPEKLAPSERVLLISIDTLRRDYLGIYGNQGGLSPHIDALAERSIVFRHAISSNPITLPAHATLLTGTHPTRHGVHDNNAYRLEGSHATLAELLAPHGFRTGAVIGAAVLNRSFGLAQGFELYQDRFPSALEGDTTFYSERTAEEVSDLGIRFLVEHAAEPFFLFLHYYDPHQKLTPPPRFAREFPDDPYAAEVAYTDEQIGRVLSKLEELGLEDSTLVVLTADHGESLGAFGEETHAYFIYQVTQSIPLVIHVPGMSRRREVDRVAGLVDVVPTVLSQLGLALPERLQGRDLSPLWGDSPPRGSERVLMTESLTPTKVGCNPLLGAVSDRWKYIHTTRPELYDLAKDPEEKTDVAGENPEVVERMRQSLDRIVRDRSDPAVSPFEIDEATRAGIEMLGYLDVHVDDRLEVDPTRDDPKDCLQLYAELLRLMTSSQGQQWDSARAAARQLLARRPEMAEVYRYLGGIALAEENWAQAVSNLRIYLTLTEARANEERDALRFATGKQRADATNLLGLALMRSGLRGEALVHFREAIDLDPSHATAHFNVGYTLDGMGRKGEALASVNRALEIDPSHQPALDLRERLESDSSLP